MPRKTATAAPKKQKPAPDVSSFMDQLVHPLKPQLEEVRALILGVDKSISEEVKWNAPSFRTHEFFATMHLRSHDQVQLVFHLGARAKDNASKAMQGIPDPSGLIRWLAADRCLVSIPGDAVRRHRNELKVIVREWIARM